MNLALELMIAFLLAKWLGWDLFGLNWWIFVALVVLSHQEALRELKVKIVERKEK